MNVPFGKSVAFAAALLALTLTPKLARAEGPFTLHVDWSKLAEVIQTGGASILPREGAKRRDDVDDAPDRWFDVSPHLSLVARDWGATQLLVGAHTLATDVLRLDRSSRMIVSRLLFGSGRIAPFAQLGLGQWRIDTSLLPSLPQDVELATQLATGFELRLTRTWKLAIEADYTILYRENHEPEMVTSPWLWGAFMATRATF